MNITQQQIQELPLKERRQFGAEANYFLSKEYFAHKRRKRTMLARTLTELEIDDGNRNDRISSLRCSVSDHS